MLGEADHIAPPICVPPLYRSPALITCLLATGLLFVLVGVVLPGVLIGFGRGQGGDAATFTLLALILVGGPAGLLIWATVALRRASYAAVQQDRDRFAEDVGAILLAGGDPPPFSLYLRPFFTDGELTADEGYARYLAFLDPTQMAEIGQRHDAERAAAGALERHAPLISLGRPSDRLGAGRLLTDDRDWFPVFELLVRHARRIIIVPIGQPATLMEIRKIAATPDLLAKTVFVRPANRTRRHFAFGPDQVKSVRDMWQWTREQLRECLPEFPPFRGGARLIVFPEHEQPLEHHGDGFVSVQHPSGMRDFVVEGRSRPARTWLLLAFLPLMALAWLAPIPWSLGEGASYGSAPNDDGYHFMWSVFDITTMLIGVKMLTTGDLAWRISRLVAVAAVAILAAGLLAPAVQALPLGQDEEAGVWLLRMAAVGTAAAAHLFLCLVAVCLLTDRQVRPIQIALCIVAGALMAIVPEALGGIGVIGSEGWGTAYWAANNASLAAVLAAPFLARPAARGANLVLVGLAAVIAAVAIMLWRYGRLVLFNEVIPFLGLEQMGLSYWLDFGIAMLPNLLLLSYPFLIRRWPGVARDRRWTEPLDPYPE